LTDKGGRLPLPRKSYYTKTYCAKKCRRYRSLNDLAAAMIKELAVPDDVEVTVVYDSAFDAKQVHQAARQRGFREVFPLDPNRNLSASTRGEKGTHLIMPDLLPVAQRARRLFAGPTPWLGACHDLPTLLAWSTAWPHRGLQAQALHHLLYPALRAIRTAPRHRAPQCF
jgi:hypothetical protein